MGGAQVQPLTLTRWMGIQGSENFFMFCIHIWVPHEIPSILSVRICGKNETLPPTRCQKEFSDAYAAKFRPDVVQTF